MKLQTKAMLLLGLLLAAIGCSGGEPGELSDEQKIKQASSGRESQMGQEKGAPASQ